MTENKIQSDIVLWFSQNHHKDRGCLFAINNNSNSVQSGVNNKAMGVVAGVSDLILFKDGLMVGCEIKSPSKSHNRHHIINQLEWGDKITLNGGRYMVFISKQEFVDYIEKGIDPKYTLLEIKKLIDRSKSKIKFV